MMLLTSAILRVLATGGLLPVALGRLPSRVVRPLQPLEAAEGIDGRLEDIVRIVCAERLGQDVLHPGRLEHGPNGPTRDDPGALRGGAQENAGRPEVTRDLAGNRRVLERHEDQILLGVLDRLPDRLGHLAGLAQSHAHVSPPVPHHDQRGERESPAALDHLGDPVDGDHPVRQVQRACVYLRLSHSRLLFSARLAALLAGGSSAASQLETQSGTRYLLSPRLAASPLTSHCHTLMPTAVRPCLGSHVNSGLKGQAAGTGRLGQRLDAPVVLISAPVEYDLADAALLGLLRDELAHDLGRGDVAAGFRLPAEIGRPTVHGDEGASARVVHDLGVDVVEAPEHGQPRPLRSALDLRAYPEVPDLPPLDLGLAPHHFAPAFLPTFRRMYSSAYLMPLPLYGSGFRRARSLAAVWPTSALSAPLRVMDTCRSTSAWIPSGSGKMIGCE